MLIEEKIILRPLKFTDWEKTLKWRNNIYIKKLAMMHPFPVTEMIEKEWFGSIIKSINEKIIYFTITLHNDEPIGFIRLSNINYIHKNCELGIVIGEEKYRGKGYGEEAIKLIINYHSVILT